MLSILVPCHKEPNIVKFLMDLDKEFPDAQVIVANDRYKRGKGWAVREALTQATGEYIVFIDGDGDIHPRMIWRLLPFIEDFDIVVGKKPLGGFISRRVLTFLSRIYIRVLFGIPVDTQTGVKLFRRDAISEWKSDSFAFDIEILKTAVRNGKTLVEVPVEAVPSGKMELSAVWKCFYESLKIWSGDEYKRDTGGDKGFRFQRGSR